MAVEPSARECLRRWCGYPAEAFNPCQNLCDFCFGVHPPVRRPYPVDLPSARFQYFLTPNVPGPGSKLRVVGPTVTPDPQCIAVASVRVPYREVNPKP